MHNWNPPDAYFPDFAKRRSAPWIYTGWIAKGDDYGELLERAMKVNDHGETRKVDVYPEGAVTWMKD